MAKQIVVDLVADTSDFQRQMAKAGASVDGFESKLKGADKAQEDLTATAEASKRQFMGVADLFDGLATTMGLPIEGAVGMSRGFADLADGIGTSVLPALTAMNTKIRASVGGMSKLKLGLIGVGAAAVGTAAATGSLNGVMDKAKTLIDNSITGWGRFASKIVSITKTGGPLHDLANKLGLVAKRNLDVASSGVTALDVMGNLQTTSGLDSLTPKLSVSVDDLKNWRGAIEDGFGGLRWADAPAIDDSAEKNAKVVADKIAKALKDRFAKNKDILVKALATWTDALKNAKSMRDSFKSMFGLDVQNNDPLGLVHGLRMQAQQMDKFVKKIAQLRKMGFAEGLVRSLVDRGPSALADATELSHVSKKDVNALYGATQQIGGSFANNEAYLRTGVNTANPKPLKVTLDVKGGDKELRDMIKKWVRTDGGGNVQVAFGRN